MSLAWRGVLALSIVALLSLGSCLPVPLGDPATSKVDPALRGYWLNQERGESMLALIAPFDERTYVIDSVSNDKAGHLICKAWRTEIKGKVFLTLQSISNLADPNEKAEYPTFRLDLKDNQLEATMLKREFKGFKDVQDAASLAKVVSEHVNDPEMYDDVLTFQKLDPKKSADRSTIDSFMTQRPSSSKQPATKNAD
ncbi:MAG TPA: hypothetical protein VIL86_08030 [Tepidisphaeraceae bacterium]|jgi:hypothetical protein